MGRLKVSTTAHLEEEQLDALEKLCIRTGKPVAVLIREGIDMILERERHNIPKPRTESDVCVWCAHNFGVLAENKDGRPVRCFPECATRTSWQKANRPVDVSRVMAQAKKRMDDLSCRPPGTLLDD